MNEQATSHSLRPVSFFLLALMSMSPLGSQSFANTETDEDAPPSLEEEMPPLADTPSTETPSVLDDAPSPESADESTEPPVSIADTKEELPPVQTSRSKRHRHPRYQYQRPGWGGMLSYSPDAFGGNSGITGLAGESLRALHFSYEWQPRFLQAIGVIGLGPQLGAYPILPEGDVLSGPTSIWSYGARIHYQARFFREQPIVPFVSYTYEKLSYELKAGTTGTGTLTGMSFGGMILLNWLEPHAAAEAFVSSGVLRTYLVTEYRQLSGTYSTGGGPSGNTLSFGLRLEH